MNLSQVKLIPSDESFYTKDFQQPLVKKYSKTETVKPSFKCGFSLYTYFMNSTEPP